MKLLVIDDSCDLLSLLRLELATLGHTVLTAETAEAGLEAAARERPQVVISDLGLPGIDGFDLVRRLRAHRDLGGTPVIALSGYGESALFETALAAGFDAAVAKP